MGGKLKRILCDSQQGEGDGSYSEEEASAAKNEAQLEKKGRTDPQHSGDRRRSAEGKSDVCEEDGYVPESQRKCQSSKRYAKGITNGAPQLPLRMKLRVRE
ncbi:unnamed protein product [Sphagnum balticum]